jgi:hypothetical protein
MVDSESESAAMAFARRKWMDGATYSNDGSIGDIELSRCMLESKKQMCYGNRLEKGWLKRIKDMDLGRRKTVDEYV